MLTCLVSDIPPVAFTAPVSIFSMFGHVLLPVRVLCLCSTFVIGHGRRGGRGFKCKIGTIFCKMSVFVALEARKKSRFLCVATTPLVLFDEFTMSGGR